MADVPGGARAGPGTTGLDQEEDSVWEAGGLRCADWGDVQVWGDVYLTSVYVIECDVYLTSVCTCDWGGGGVE